MSDRNERGGQPAGTNEPYGDLFGAYANRRPANLFDQDAEQAPSPKPSQQSDLFSGTQPAQGADLFGNPTPPPQRPAQQRQPNLFDQDQGSAQRYTAPQNDLFGQPAANRHAPTQNTVVAPAARPQKPAPSLFEETAKIPKPRGAAPAQPQDLFSQTAPRVEQPTVVMPQGGGQRATPKPDASLFEETTIMGSSSTSNPTAFDRTTVRPAARGEDVFSPTTQLEDPAAYHDAATRIGTPVGNGNGNGGQPPKKPGKGGKKGGGKGGNGKVAKHMGKNVLKGLFALFCVCVMLAGIFAVFTASYIVESTKDDDLILDLSTLSENGAMYAQNPATGEWVVYQEITGTLNRTWYPITEMTDHLANAAVATEDKDFWDHGGFSATRTMAAALNEVIHFRPTFGGSTIDQQVVKNITGDKATRSADGDMSSGYQRKLREIFRAIGLNNNYSKMQIMEAYLNTIPLSGTITGVGAGAKEYFNKTPSQLEVWEAAMIVGITNSPYYYNPYLFPDACLTRRNDVLYFMWQDEYIDDATYQNAVKQPLGLYDGPKDTVNDSSVSTWYADEVYRQVTADLVAKGIVSAEDASAFYYNSGLRIELPIDLSVQSALEEMYLHAYEEGSPFPATEVADVLDANGNPTGEQVHPQSAAVVLDPEGNVIAVVGAVGEKEGNLMQNHATMSYRHAGSTMKMVATYPLGIEYDLINWSTLLEDTPSLTSEGRETTDASKQVWPTNYGQRFSGNMITVQHAVAESLNTIAVRVGRMLGTDEMYSFVTETMRFDKIVEADNAYSPLVLGGQTYGVSPLEMAAAYVMYSNGGDYYQPRFYTRVLDSNGNVVLEADNYPIKVISDETAFIGLQLMKTVFTDGAGGTAYGMQPDRLDYAGKSGTSSDDLDRWFVGITPYYTTAVWWGYEDNYEITNTRAGASTNPPLKAWRELMNTVQADLEERSFTQMPEGVTQERYCTITGFLAGDGCESTALGYYKKDSLPTTCQGH